MHVLIAPLDWGLGHASRCIHIIQLLLAKGCTVFIASDGPQEQLLRLEFPKLTYLRLPGYGVTYAKKWLIWRLASQVFKIKSAIRQEHNWLNQVIAKEKIDWVISDNRYGLWSSVVPCTFITHQLRVQMPPGLKWAEAVLQKQLYKFIERFNTCWVPDLPNEENGLSGALGHPGKKPAIPIFYIGWLSRFSKSSDLSSFSYKCLIILSGPEPQRTILERILVKQLQTEKRKMILIRGLPKAESEVSVPLNITVHNHLKAEEMQKAFNNSEFIVSRSGYSTVMDVFTLHKKCVFIPTPGQTEQEYLAERLAANKMALIFKQQGFTLQSAMNEASIFNFHFPVNSLNSLLEKAVNNYLQTHSNNTKAASSNI